MSSMDSAKDPLMASVRDSSFFARQAHDSGYSRWHAIVDRGSKRGRGPACGYPLHDEDSEIEAKHVEKEIRCNRPGCKQAFTRADSAGH